MVNMNTWTLEITFFSFPSSFRSPESSGLTSVYRNSLNSWRDVKCIPHSADPDAEGTWVEAVERVLLLCLRGHSSWKAEVGGADRPPTNRISMHFPTWEVGRVCRTAQNLLQLGRAQGFKPTGA